MYWGRRSVHNKETGLRESCMGSLLNCVEQFEGLLFIVLLIFVS